MKLIDLRQRLLSELCGIGDPSYEADAVISFLYGFDKTEITLRLFDEIPPRGDVENIVSRRTSGEPLEYIVGKAPFFGYEFFVSPDCLIPQADTETVVSEAIKKISRGGRFLDIGTGSGCIASVIAKEVGARGVAVDISRKALDVAKKNADALGVSDMIDFICADVFGENDLGRFDLVVSNPPYVKTAVIPTLPKEVLHEPISALDGGADGLDFYRRIIKIAPSLLKDGGSLVFEIGYDEAEAVGAILSQNGFEYYVKRDYGGNDRCIVARAVSEEI